ncbi:MAG TPA: DUF4294 domain-containing protein [Parabacteroides sp.]|nr:DUF4294 domain-containing protein [Parabacteroides sp.]
MREQRTYIISLIAVFFLLSNSLGSMAQEQPVPMKVLPEGYLRAYVDGADTVAVVQLKDLYVFPKPKFRNKKEEAKYWKLVRDVKKTLPFAKMVYATLIETYEYIETLPDEKAKQAHLKRMEKELFAQYKPQLKKMTLSQGKLLIKLIDRECNQSSYNLVKAFLGSFRAGFWNVFAGMFGASLKTEYDPHGKDALIERIVILVERGEL